MNRFIKHFDGTGRDPRPKQIEALDWIDETWSTGIVGLAGPTGVGKTAIGRAIQKEFGGIYTVSSNSLMDQLIGDYPNVNYLKGAAHYQCGAWKGSDVTCEDVGSIQNKRCDKCPYETCKSKALNMNQTFVNPMSFMYLKNNMGYKPHNTLIIDEAHTLMSYLLMVSGSTISIRKFGEPSSLKVPDVLAWVDKTIKTLTEERKTASSMEDKTKAHRKIETLSVIRKGLYEDPNLYVIYNEKNFIHVKPIRPPRFVVEKFLDSSKIILMSATLNRFSVRELLQHDNFAFKDLDSPIPVENRQVLFQPSSFQMNYKTPPKLVAAWIKGKMKQHPNRNTMVHLSYSDILKVQEFFPDAICNTSDDKVEKINEFKNKGGLFLAGGCAEGVDLPNDECRLNLIPRLIKPNLGDPIVKKRKALIDGSTWYNMTVMNTLEQQVGRSNRGVDDFSTSIVGDVNLKWMYEIVKDNVNMSFKEAINWRSR